MTSLREASRGRPVDRIALAAAFVDRLERGVQSLHGGRFDAAAWSDRQVTTGRTVRIDRPDGTDRTTRALGVDATTGALIVEDPDAPGGQVRLVVGEIGHVRIADPVVGGV